MKINIKSLITLILTSLVISSCSDFLNTSPKDSLDPADYYNSEKNLEAALTGVYSMLGNSRIYGNTYVSQLGNDADESYYFRSTYTYGPVIYNHTSADQNVADLWSNLYNGIARANLLLHYLPDAEVDGAIKDRIKGEALFLRGYFHFLLVQNYGKIPIETKAKLIPENLDTPESEIADVYQQIVTDMSISEDLVKDITEIKHGGRVTKSAVRGILARVYLTMAGEPLKDKSKYEEAKNCLLRLMNDASANHELNPDYRQVFINYAQDKYDIKESIWEVEFWGNLADAYQETGTIGGLNGINNDYDDEIGLSRGMYAATGSLYKLYDANDTIRRDWNIAPFTYSSVKDPSENDKYITEKVYQHENNIWRRYLGKYRREMETLKPKAAHSTPINFPLLRFSDVLLMYAEVENEINRMPTTEAYEAINEVRRRAFGKKLPGAQNVNEYDLSSMNYFLFSKAIREERSRELCFEALRKQDLIRWGIFVETMNDMVDVIEYDMETIKENAYKPASFSINAFANVKKKHVLQPKPSKELSLNRNLKQNPNW